MTSLRALIFDVDGTIAETERDGHRLAFNQGFQEFGLDWHWDENLYGELLHVAGGKERLRHYIDHYQPPLPTGIEATALVPELHRAKTRHYTELLAHRPLPLRPGIRRLMLEARSQNLTLAIATTAALPNVLALLKQSLDPQADQWFQVIAAGDVVPRKKPAPDIYLYTLEKLNLRPEHCLVIEDSHQGLRAAKDSGLKTVITVHGYTKDQNFEGANLLLDHLGEPDAPFTVLNQKPVDRHYLDLAIARQILESQ